MQNAQTALERIAGWVRPLSCLVSLGLLAGTPLPASGLVIDVTYNGKFQDETDPNKNLYQEVAHTAVTTWQDSTAGWNRVTDYHVGIEFGTGDLGTAFALTYGNSQTAGPTPLTGTHLWVSAKVDLNANSSTSGWNSFFWDQTPLANDEYNMTQYGNKFGTAKSGSPADGKEDAYSVILHELGHALGFIGASAPAGEVLAWFTYTDFENNLNPPASDIFTFDYLPSVKGKTIPMQDPYHIDGGPNSLSGGAYSLDTMAAYSGGGSGPDFGQRRLLSDLDLSMIADAFHTVPVPKTIVLVVVGWLVLVWRDLRVRQRTSPTHPGSANRDG
jgi:hypothetical protein